MITTQNRDNKMQDIFLNMIGNPWIFNWGHNIGVKVTPKDRWRELAFRVLIYTLDDDHLSIKFYSERETWFFQCIQLILL